MVDLDLEKFFDRVQHDVLMARVARKVGGKRVLRLIRRYLQAGLMKDGLVEARREGTPQGGPLSPLLSNILLDELDRELERKVRERMRAGRGQKLARLIEEGLTPLLRGWVNRLGLDEGRAFKSAANGRGPWWNAGASHMNAALPKKFFDGLGFRSWTRGLNFVNLHKPPYAEPHVRWCGRTARVT